MAISAGLTVLAVVVAAVAISSAGDDLERREFDARVAALTGQRDDALADVAAIETELATVRGQLQDASDAGDDLGDQVGELEARVVALTEQRAEAIASADALVVTVGELEAAVAESTGRVDLFDAALRTANDRLAAMTAERDAFAGLFPIGFDASLGDGRDAGLVGVHDVDPAQVYCSDASSCTRVAGIDEVRIRRTAVGNLRLEIPGVVEGGLFRADGALHLVADSTAAVPACGGVARTADVTMTLFPAGYRIDPTGTVTVAGVNAVMTVEAPTTGDCGTALASFTLELTPRS